MGLDKATQRAHWDGEVLSALNFRSWEEDEGPGMKSEGVASKMGKKTRECDVKGETVSRKKD